MGHQQSVGRGRRGDHPRDMGPGKHGFSWSMYLPVHTIPERNHTVGRGREDPSMASSGLDLGGTERAGHLNGSVREERSR